MQKRPEHEAVQSSAVSLSTETEEELLYDIITLSWGRLRKS